MGRKVTVVAVFEVISVKNTIAITITNRRTMVDALDKKVKLEPNQAPKPELIMAEAKESPPPKRRSNPHGKFLACSQINNSVDLFCDGMIKKLTAAMMAIPASVNPEKKGN